MEIALYDPARGYYRGAVARPGRAGDFLTAPEASPIFGRTIARFALAVHAALGAPGTFPIREHGAGTGALAAPLVAALLAAEGGPPAVRYLVDEVEPERVAAVRATVAAAAPTAGRGDRSSRTTGVRSTGSSSPTRSSMPCRPTGCVGRAGGLREVLVGIGPDGGLVDVEGEPSSPALAARLAAESIALDDGQRAEICLALDGWIERAAAGLGRGVLLLIDYGHPAADLYDPAPAGGRDARDVPRPPGRRRPVRRDRAAGHHRPCRRHGGRAGRRRGRARRRSDGDPGASSSPASAPASCSSPSRPVRAPASRRISRRARPSSG